MNSVGELSPADVETLMDVYETVDRCLRTDPAEVPPPPESEDEVERFCAGFVDALREFQKAWVHREPDGVYLFVIAALAGDVTDEEFSPEDEAFRDRAGWEAKRRRELGGIIKSL